MFKVVQLPVFSQKTCMQLTSNRVGHTFEGMGSQAATLTSGLLCLYMSLSRGHRKAHAHLYFPYNLGIQSLHRRRHSLDV